MTLAEKLENFKTTPVGIAVRTREVAVLLGEVMETIGIKGNMGGPMMFAMGMCWEKYRKSKEMYVTKNHPQGIAGRFGAGVISRSGRNLDEIYEVTVEELKEYLDTIGYLKKLQKPTCFTCKFYDNYSGACGNGLSEYRGDFTNATDSCEQHERG
jgi:hypothetical protein